MRSRTGKASVEAAILNRVIRPMEHDLPLPVARELIKLSLDESDRARMHELARKNRLGALTEQERAELDGYVHVGMALDMLQAKARLSIKRAGQRP